MRLKHTAWAVPPHNFSQSLPAINQTAIESFGSNRANPQLKHNQSPTTQNRFLPSHATLRTACVQVYTVWQLDPC